MRRNRKESLQRRRAIGFYDIVEVIFKEFVALLFCQSKIFRLSARNERRRLHGAIFRRVIHQPIDERL